MADSKTISAHVESWFQEPTPQPLLLTGSSADMIARRYIDSQERNVEVVQVPEDSRTIKIAEVRDLLTQLERTSLQSRRLVYIPRCERLLVASANALLKKLEEPGRATSFLLTSAYPGRLLATIRSRCRILRTQSISIQTPVHQIPPFDSKRKTPLTDEETNAIGQLLMHKIATGTHNPVVRRSLMRLRDYYKITASGGNSRLAGDVLLASLAELRDTGNIR